MTTHRDIAPRPRDFSPSTTTTSGATSTTIPARLSRVAIACQPCRTRRTKCDGAKPTCRTCIDRHSTCTYSPPTGTLLAQAQKRKIKELENDNNSLYEILWYLQTKAPSRATALLQHMRAGQGQDIEALFRSFEQKHADSDQPLTANQDNAEDSSSSEGESPVAALLTVPEVMDHPRLSSVRKGQSGVTGLVLYSPVQSRGTSQELHGPLNMFFDCVGALFYIVTREEALSGIAAITAAGKNHVPLGDFYSDGSSLELRTLSATLAGMAAIGVVHAHLADPVTAPPAELADYFYTVAKHGLDSAILYDPFRAMKVCALLGMYNIVVKATVALAHIELGLSLARNHKLNLKQCPPDWTSSTYNDIRRTHRTLVHLQCWLSASLDHNSASLSSIILSPFEDLDAPPEDMIRRECVKVSIIKATLLHQIPTRAPVPEATILDFRAQLSKFHAQLPDWMTAAKLFHGDGGELMATFRPVIFYVHLFYLSAMMLLSRRLIIAFIPVDAVGVVSLPPEAQRAIEEGYQAAQMNVSVMNLMLQEGKVVQVCWLCVYTAYTAGIMIAHRAAQKALHGGFITADLKTLEKCTGVLQYCAEKDALAGKLHNLLTSQLSTLQRCTSPSSNSNNNNNNNNNNTNTDMTTPTSPPIHHYLFDFRPASSELERTAKELLQIIHRPFSKLKNVATQQTLSNRAETTMGTHLEWEYELKGSDCAQDMLDSVRNTDSASASASVLVSPSGAYISDIGASRGPESSGKRPCVQPEPQAWSKWTPPTWQKSFRRPSKS